MFGTGAIHGFGARQDSAEIDGGKFGRLFPNLPAHNPCAVCLRKLAAAMQETGSAPSSDNPCIPAAYTYLGQFIDHDLTFDATTVSGSIGDPGASRNFRTPAFDLDSVYGAGPNLQPYLYRRDDPDLFEIGVTESFPDTGSAATGCGGTRVTGRQADLPRAFNRYALIADARNDENLILAQLHLALLHFHNEVVRYLRHDPDVAPGAVFERARALVKQHYQNIVLNDFLPRVVHASDLAFVRSRPFLTAAKGTAFIPVEFAAAAYRFGHTMIRPSYRISSSFHAATLEQLLANSGRSRPKGDPVHAPITEHWIVSWPNLLGENGSANVFSRSIDPYLTQALTQLPLPAGPFSLAERNLERGREKRLPDGQSVAAELKVQPLTRAKLSTGPDGAVAAALGFDQRTPLWYYILKEASAIHGGRCLGPVGGRIVADVFYGLMSLESDSILNIPNWRPTLGTTGKFTLADLLAFAKVMEPGKENGPNLNELAGRMVCGNCYTPQ